MVKNKSPEGSLKEFLGFSLLPGIESNNFSLLPDILTMGLLKDILRI